MTPQDAWRAFEAKRATMPESTPKDSPDFVELKELHEQYTNLKKEATKADRKEAKVDPETKSCFSLTPEYKALRDSGALDSAGAALPNAAPIARYEMKTETPVTGIRGVQTLGGVGQRKARSGAILGLIPTFTVPAGVSAINYTRQTAASAQATNQAEGTAHPESSVAFSAQTATLQTIGVFKSLSRQAVSNEARLEAAVSALLHDDALARVEAQIIAGSGDGVQFAGLKNSVVSGVNEIEAGAEESSIDALERALAGLKYNATGIIIHPTDWSKMARLRENPSYEYEDGGSNVVEVPVSGGYVLGGPLVQAGSLWGVPVAISAQAEVGFAVMGDFAGGAELHVSEAADIRISSEHGTNFTQGLATLLAEVRAAFCVTDPSRFARVELEYSA